MRQPRLRDASAVQGVYVIVYQHLGARTLSLSACVLALGEPEVRH